MCLLCLYMEASGRVSLLHHTPEHTHCLYTFPIRGRQTWKPQEGCSYHSILQHILTASLYLPYKGRTCMEASGRVSLLQHTSSTQSLSPCTFSGFICQVMPHLSNLQISQSIGFIISVHERVKETIVLLPSVLFSGAQRDTSVLFIIIYIVQTEAICSTNF